MRILRIGVIIAFVAVCVATVMLFLSSDEDTTMPVINCSVEQIEAKCSVEDEELLSYVTAVDEKDGDLTKNIVVESVSGFIERGVSRVTFAVCDNDDHVVKKTVDLVYTDYKDPIFTSRNDLMFSVGELADLSDDISVKDVFDGDVTGWLITSAENFSTAMPGTYNVDYSVTTGKSYTYSITIPVIVESYDKSLYDIILSRNIAYCDPGAKLDYNSFVESVVTPYTSGSKYELQIDDSKADLSKPGVYSVFYNAVVGGSTVAKTRLIIVCGEIEQ